MQFDIMYIPHGETIENNTHTTTTKIRQIERDELAMRQKTRMKEIDKKAQTLSHIPPNTMPMKCISSGT